MKHIAIRQTLIANETEVATKLIEISTKMCYVYANLAVAIAKAKFGCYLAQKHTKSQLTKAMSKLVTKIGYLGLKINMQSARQTELGTVTRKPPKGLF